MEPFDVFDAGRMAIVQDPTGAFVAAWEPRSNIGARLVNATGALTWADVITPDPDRASQFFGDWLGWTVKEMPGGQGYRVIANGERSNGGMVPLDPATMPGVPPHWMPYFGTDDLAVAQARATELGGRVLMGPIEVPNGAFTVVEDPQGAVFGLLSGPYDD